MLYKKPEIKSYSAGDLVEIIGPCQSQYTTTTFYTTTGNSSVNVDGMVSSAGDVAASWNIEVGDTSPSDIILRGFIGFDISSIQGMTIVSATLRLYQYTVTGTPYTTLGTIVADHVNFGSSLDAADYSAAALTSSIGTISNSATIEWKTLDVSSYVQADINSSRTSSQYRIRFTTGTDSDGIEDLSRNESVENFGSTGNRPELVVTYR